MHFTHTIRFKLTLWYSLLLMTFAVIFVVFMNIIVTRFFNNDPVQPLPFIVTRNPMMMERWEEMTEIQREIVREFRKEDLKRVRSVSLYSLIPLALLSFSGGYVISGQMLYPIKKLNKEMKRKTPDTLDRKIEHHDVGDEMSELINNFNNMTTRLGEAFALQKEFVENASHELKTPLAVIRTNLDSALLDAHIPKNELDEYIHQSIASLTFMDKLIEDLLLLSLLEKQLKMNTIDLNKVVKNTVNQLKIVAREKKIGLVVEQDRKKNKLEGNEVLMQRAIMNIVENAIKYSPKGSKVRIITKREKERIIISISDQGAGIDKKDQAHIFERFYRVDKSRSRKSGGSGLGLAIVKKIIEMHGGIITLESSKGKGSTFKINMPSA